MSTVKKAKSMRYHVHDASIPMYKDDEREHIASVHGSAFSAERDKDGDLKIFHNSKEGLATQTLGDRRRRDAEMARRTTRRVVS